MPISYSFLWKKSQIRNETISKSVEFKSQKTRKELNPCAEQNSFADLNKMLLSLTSFLHL